MDRRIADLGSKLEESGTKERMAQDEIVGLQELAGVDSTEALRGVIDRSERLKQAVADRSEAIASAESQGDGKGFDELEVECIGVDLDDARSREQVLEKEQSEARKLEQEARDALRDARSQFEGIGGSSVAARAEAARQGALAEIQEVAEHYVRTRSASAVLRWAIDRFRREKQGPMLQKAGELFADLTLGSFENLELAYDNQDRPRLVGRRESGERVAVEGMSDGTVDQLFLALRIAALEDYLKHAQPLPFIADDLFVNFDDRRAEAGLRVLGDLAKNCQVLFFTHHDHLVTLAESALPQPMSVVRLDR